MRQIAEVAKYSYWFFLPPLKFDQWKCSPMPLWRKWSNPTVIGIWWGGGGTTLVLFCTINLELFYNIKLWETLSLTIWICTFVIFFYDTIWKDQKAIDQKYTKYRGQSIAYPIRWTYEAAFYWVRPLVYLAPYCLFWLKVAVQGLK